MRARREQESRLFPTANDSQVRWRAAWALGEMGPLAETAIPAIRGLVKDKSAWVRLAAASALVEIDPKEAEAATGVITELLGHEDVDVRLAAVFGLGKIGAEAAPAIPALGKLLADSEANVRRAAYDAVTRINHSRSES